MKSGFLKRVDKQKKYAKILEKEMKAQYDAACKRLLSEKIVLVWILKECVQEFSGVDVERIAERYIEGTPSVAETPVHQDETLPARVKGTNTEDSSTSEGTITYDIRFRATAPVSGELIQLIVNVEAQNKYRPGYPLLKRGVYYCSRMISSQYGTEFDDNHYEQIKKIYSIWVCTGAPQYLRNTISKYSFEESNIVGNVSEKREDYDLMSVVMIRLGDADEDNSGVLRLLEVLLSNKSKAEEKQRILEEDFGIPMTQTLERQVSLMCNLSQDIEEKGIKKGIEQGAFEVLFGLVRDGIISAKEAASRMNLPESEFLNRMKTYN